MTIPELALMGIIPGLIAFICGHWSADLLWFSLVSISIHKSKTVLSARMYQGILTVCGVLLIIFGMWFLTQAF